MLNKIFLLGILCITLCHGAELKTNEEEARGFLMDTSKIWFATFDENADHAFSNTSHETYNVRDETRKYSRVMKNSVDSAMEFDFANFKDAELKYAFVKVIETAGEQIIGPEAYLDIYECLEELENLTTHRIVGEYGNSEKKVSIATAYDKVFERSNDPEELQYYWRTLRELTGNWAMNNLDIMLKGLRDAASLSGKSPLEFWLHGLNFTDLENFITETQPFYEQLHAFLRKQLHSKFGESIIDSEGLIPDHLLESVDFQLMTNHSVIEELFPYKNLPALDKIIAEKYNSKDLYQIADKFYEKLGFEKFPASIWGDRIRQSEYYNSGDFAAYEYDSHDESKDDGGHYDYKDHMEHSNENDIVNFDEDDDLDDEKCVARIHYWTPNVYLEYCPQMNYTDFLEAYLEMGCLYYAKEMKGLPAYYFDAPHSLQIAIGNAMVFSASSYHNLQSIGLIPEETEITPEVELNRLFRMAIRSMIHTRSSFIHAKLMADLLAGDVKVANLNAHYWELMAKYLGVEPPKGHTTKTFDMDEMFYQDMSDNYMSSALIVEVLSYQIHKKLCELSGKYPNRLLHQCDISGSKEAGNALRKMMQLGASKPYHEVLATMLPENPSISSEDFLKYYKPIENMLAENNKKENVKTGW